MATKKYFNSVCLFLVGCVLLGGVWNIAWSDDPNEFNDPQGVFSITTGIMDVGSPCPAWEEALSRNGSDGGQLTIELDTCQVAGYEIYSMPQSGGAASTADLIPDDLIIVWDEDPGHGEDEQYKNFTFTGSYVADANVADPNTGYVRLTTTQQSTNWAIYRVTESGLFTKGQEGTNEHELIHFYNMTLDKVDDVNDLNCIFPESDIVYTICYENLSDLTLDNVYIIYWLPPQVDYDYIISFSPPTVDPNYNPADHSYRFPIGTLEPYESGCVQLTVTVNYLSDPLVPIHNVAELWDDDIHVWDAEEDTSVCYWDMGSVVYVDTDAPPGGNGTSWSLAYNDLQDGLARIRLNNDPNVVFEVRVANGVYNPGDAHDPFYTYTDTFEIPDGISVYGGYAGYGAPDPNERIVSKYKTVLSGYISQYARNNIVVKLNDGCLLDGVTVTEAADYGIYGDGASFSVLTSTIANNQETGVYCNNGDLTVLWCGIDNNGQRGIHHRGNGYSLTCENSKIFANEWDGILTDGSTSTILNSLIYQNGLGSSQYSSYYGINLINPSGSPTIRNCTVVQNVLSGIRRSGGAVPTVKNSILFYNDSISDFNDLEGIASTWHCCLTDPSDPETVKSNPTPDSRGNIFTHPGFAYTTEPNNLPVAGNYHLAYSGSPCVNAGDPNETGVEELDIDGEPRENGTIDIGADEMTACGNEPVDISHPLDWSANGIIGMEEYAVFAASWLAEAADPNDAFNPQCDLNDDDTIDLEDLEIFCADWLWTACWKQSQFEMYGTYSMMSGGGIVAEASSFGISAVIPAQAGIQREESAFVAEKSLDQQILDLEYAIEFLEQVWMEDDQIQQEIDPQKWQEFMDSVYQCLTDLQAESIQLE